jgi:HEAT repeat protein
MFQFRTFNAIIELPKLQVRGAKMHDSSYYENLGPSEVYDLQENEGVEGLIRVLRHNPHKEVISLVMNALGELKDKKAVDTIIEKGLKSEYVSIRDAAIRALEKIGSDEATEPLIYVMLKYKNTRAAAIRALGKIKDSRAVKSLIMLMHDENEELLVRKEAAQALGSIGGKEAVAGLIASLDSGTFELNERIAQELVKLGETAVMPLIAMLSGDSEGIMWKAATILGEIGDKRAVKPLIALLLDDSKDECDRGNYVATALGKIGDTEAVDPLIELALKRDENTLTCMSIRALGNIGDDRAAEPLIGILEDESTVNLAHLRLETCWALGKLKDVRSTEPLIKILEGSSDNKFGLADAAASALVQLDDDRIELPLLRYYGCTLDSLISSKAFKQIEQQAMVEGLSKLLARLISKY